MSAQPPLLALIIALVSVPGVFCCLGYMTGAVAIVMGIIGVVQHSNGDHNPASKISGLTLSWGQHRGDG